jgi:hypothetical protein
MSNSRARDEGRAYAHHLGESVGPAAYVLGPPRRCRPEFIADPRVSSQGHLASVCSGVPLVDVDSELLGLTRKLSACPADAYNPNTSPPCPLTHVRESDGPSGIESEDCRMSNPACTLRGTGWNRWEWLPCNPQDNALREFETLVDYRRVVKDNHRPLLARPATPGPPTVAKSGLPHALVVGDDLARTLASLPDRPTNAHWRTEGELRRIRGECSAR